MLANAYTRHLPVLTNADLLACATQESFAKRFRGEHPLAKRVCIAYTEAMDGFVPPAVVNLSSMGLAVSVRVPIAVLETVWPPSRAKFHPHLRDTMRRIVRSVRDSNACIVVRVDISNDLGDIPAEFRVPRSPAQGEPRLIDPKTLVEYFDCIDIVVDSFSGASARLLATGALGELAVAIEVTFPEHDRVAATMYDMMLTKKQIRSTSKSV